MDIILTFKNGYCSALWVGYVLPPYQIMGIVKNESRN